MITVAYKNQTIKDYDIVLEGDRRLLIASLMTIDEMVKFLSVKEVPAIAKKLKLNSKGAKKAVCSLIYAYFHTK